MLSVRPKVAELSFHVFGRPLHPELYDVHQSRIVQRSEYQARIEITNCGHVITWSGCENADGNRITICEVASSATQPLPKDRCRINRRLKGSRTERWESEIGPSYKTHFQLETVTPDMFWMVQNQLGKSPTEGLIHHFDASGRMAFGGLSYINVELRQRSMLIQAIHTFPDDHAYVKIESVFATEPQ